MPAYRRPRPRQGFYPHIRLGFSESELDYDPDYRWTRGEVDLSFSVQDAATLLPTAPLTWSMTCLLEAIPDLAAGRSVTIEDVQHTWQVTLHSHRAREVVTITQRIPSGYATLRDAEVPLRRLLSEMVRIADEWRRWIAARSPTAAADETTGKEYRRLAQALEQAKRALTQLRRTP